MKLYQCIKADKDGKKRTLAELINMADGKVSWDNKTEQVTQVTNAKEA